MKKYVNPIVMVLIGVLICVLAREWISGRLSKRRM